MPPVPSAPPQSPPVVRPPLPAGPPQAMYAPGYPPGYPPPPGFAPGYQIPNQYMARPPGYAPMPGAFGYPPPGPGFNSRAMDLKVNWAPAPNTKTGVPPGLEYLTAVDQLLVHQKVELLEIFTGFETSNKYLIKNSQGQKVYLAIEDTDCCTRNCCGATRPFDMKILDHQRREVIHLYRPLRCESCCYPCCLQELEVMAPPGVVVGYVHQEWACFVPRFKVKNAAGETVLRIEGPFCVTSICGDVQFEVLTADGSTVLGHIVKQWSGLLREAFTDADHFGITFPKDLDVNIKAVLLGATFLIDFMYFEKTQNDDQNSTHWG